MADVVGSAEFELRASRQQMKKDLEDAKRDLGGFVSEAEREVGGSTSRLSGMMGKLGLAVGALSAIIGAGIALAVKFGGASLEMADTLANSARRIADAVRGLNSFIERFEVYRNRSRLTTMPFSAPVVLTVFWARAVISASEKVVALKPWSAASIWAEPVRVTRPSTDSRVAGVEDVDYTAWNAGVTIAVTSRVGVDFRYYDTDAEGEKYESAIVAALTVSF